jgi:hypothetical protein
MQIYAPELFKSKVKWRTAERDAYFRENRDVDVSILAENLKLNYRFCLSYMQKLGLRPFAPTGRRKDA